MTPPKWYVGNDEPKSQQGINMGLTVLLDAHTDILGGSSVYGDFKGFKGLISTKGSFPFVNRNGFAIQPGERRFYKYPLTHEQLTNQLRNILVIKHILEDLKRNQSFVVSKPNS